MTDRLSPQREAEIAARTEAATKGPWFIHDDWPGRVFSESQFNHHIARVTGSNPEANERFIAHAREDVSALLAELAAVRTERDEAVGERDHLMEWQRRVTEEVEEFEDAADDDPDAPNVARLMIANLRRAMDGGDR